MEKPITMNYHEVKKQRIITYSVLISYCLALRPYEKHELIKPEWVIDGQFCPST